MKYESQKEDAYQVWLEEDVFGTRFTVVGQGPLIRDQKTGMFYDAVEFLMRKFRDEKPSNQKATR